ncbi:MAG: glycerol-3-phosphate acyltransferase [Chloroflexota bacterium]
MNIGYFLIAGLIGYILGSIPFGFLYVKAKTGKDIRTIGSGRMGGTNSYRAGGVAIGILTALSDFLKGAVSIWAATWLFADKADPTLLPWIVTTGGVMAVMGHNWSVFLKFKGGAGTGPNIGWATAVWWPIFPIGFVMMLGLFWLVGMASVASMAMALLIPLVFAIRYFMGLDPTPAYMVGGIITALAVAWALRPNFKRIAEGNERIVGPRAKRLAQKQQ